jgi:hypothetical protein
MGRRITRRFEVRLVALMLIVMTVAGCATLPPAQPARDLKAIAGKWAGTLQLRDGRTLPATMTITEDGTWESRVPGLDNPGPQFVGSITIVDGQYRSTSDTPGRTATVTLHEGGGKRLLRAVNYDGRSTADFQPAQ